MVRYFILVKLKGSKRFLGAIPTRKGLSKSTIIKEARRNIKKRFDFKVVTMDELRKSFIRRVRGLKSGLVRRFGRSGGKKVPMRRRRRARQHRIRRHRIRRHRIRRHRRRR